LEEGFASEWHWGSELKEGKVLTPAIAEHLVEYSFNQLLPQEADATVSTIEACKTYAPYFAATLRMQVGRWEEKPQTKFELNPGWSILLTSFSQPKSQTKIVEFPVP
jgi:hypothetical protein